MKRDKGSSSANRFLDAVYRRWLIVNCFEQLGRGLLVGSLLALGLLLLAAWQRIPPVPILIFSGTFGFFVGALLALHRRPNRRAAAVEADRQLRLDDLITSAVFASDFADADFLAAVQFMADARCAAHSPSEVLCRRLSIRSWTAIALTMSIAVTLAVIPLQPSRSQAVDANVSVLSINSSELAPASRAEHGMASVVNDPMSDDASSGSMSMEKPVNDPGSNSPSAEAKLTKSTGNTAGTGGGNSARNSAPARDLPNGPSEGRSSGRAGSAASGGAAADQQHAKGDASAGIAGSPAKPIQAVPSWSGAGPSDSKNAGATVADRIPPEDRDLVRDFFQR